MGNLSSSCRISNHSRRNVRAFVTQKAVQLDAFVASRPRGRGELINSPSAPDELSVVRSVDKRFVFRPDVACVRVLASQTRPLPGGGRFLSVFVEDEDDEDVCSKQIMHNMALSGPVTFLLYDV